MSHAPPLDHVSLVHGDFRAGNFLFDEDSQKITAWLDWELAVLGDRHQDLTWTTGAHFGHCHEDGETFLASGLLPAEQLYQRYQAATGLKVDPVRLQYYRIFNDFTSCVHMLATAARVARGGQDPSGRGRRVAVDDRQCHCRQAARFACTGALMIPDLDLQLQVVIKALRDTLMPAVDPAHRMAVEQLGLSIATLGMVRARLPLAGLKEWQDLANALALGRAVLAEAPSDAIEAALTEAEALRDVVCPPPGARPAATKAILSAVSAAVNESDERQAAGLMRTVVEHSRPSLELARAWGKSAGLEPDPDDVPEVATLLPGSDKHKEPIA